MLQLVLHYDGSDFSGWQVQPERRTVQGVLEATLSRLCDGPVRVTGAGRTDAGVHARGQAAGVEVGAQWTAERLRRALNHLLPRDVWVARVCEMQGAFHARYSATGRRYSYAVGLDEAAHSPFRRRWEVPWERALDREALDWCAERTVGTHRFLAFAVRGTAPSNDEHRCEVRLCRWREAPGGLVFDIEANRFLHHMVRFLVGTMLDVAGGRRPREEYDALLRADANDAISPPAPAQGLCLEQVTYPDELYLTA
ncbi:MAG TPA: tRNA pseudouridine(38-40) synthase TruA [Gemmatimonadaceae bacterium]|nr:tRNA pseudouridine(38-40) synthase TruA [Gemmatimonadaceae bacterium]